MGYRISDCFDCIFAKVIYEQNEDIEDMAKKLFSGSRSFPQDITRALCTKEKFELLRNNIQTKYLAIAGDHNTIYNAILSLLSSCEYMRNCDKERIIASCNPTQTAELARFIACCLVCSNYNTIQSKTGSHKTQEYYSLSLDFMELEYSIDELVLKKELWRASQRSYLVSRNKGNRFHALNIVERLLPQGFLASTHFISYGKLEDGHIAPVKELCEDGYDNISIIGDGGIGKTTFLQHLMGNAFLQSNGLPKEYIGAEPVYFFIELNRCPDHIENWYNDSLRKTNFITRYIGQVLENHSSLDTVSNVTLDLIEKELQKEPIGGNPQYILLLDGFNEVRADGSIRSYISNEISTLSHYANVRIITTSRETQSAHYASMFKNIRLVGVTPTEIFNHLRERGVSDVIIGNVKESETLLECLRIPLYLCMFAEKTNDENFLPETAGEILYAFFHRNSAYYNARKRIAETHTCKLNEKQIALILNFIIPYIGWVYENEDAFYISELRFNDIIIEALNNIKILFCDNVVNPFEDFKYNGQVLKNTVDSLYINSVPNITAIISCIYDYLGIIYQYQINDGNFSNRIRYSFCHHQFRDYFSSIWDVQILSMLQCMSTDDFSIHHSNHLVVLKKFLDMRYWQINKVRFISEILMEHRNRPYFDQKHSVWLLPTPRYDEQKVLSKAIDFCRILHSRNIETEHLLPNILSSILLGRKEYSGLDLSELNLKNCRFFNVNCSRQGKNNTLAVNFSGSILTENNFLPENHQNHVMEYVYYKNYCYTIDDSGIIKCWDIFSGKMEYELKSGNPLGVTDFSAKGYIKISPNGNWLAAKVQETQRDGDVAAIHIFNLTTPSQPPVVFQPPVRHKMLSYFAFTQDSKSILMLCDRTTVYCVDISTQNILYSSKFDLYKQSELYAESAASNIFAYTAEYDTYETDEALMSTWIHDQDSTDYDGDSWDYNDDSEENSFEDIPCALCILIPQKHETKFVYHYCSTPTTAPPVAFLPDNKSFIIYNNADKRIEQFFCENELCKPILGIINSVGNTCPAAIHLHPEQSDKIFIIYPDICFEADLTGEGHILMTYAASGIEKLLSNSDQSGELEFVPNVIPSSNRFVVANDTNTYEWDSKNDILVLKYNSALFGATALFTTQNRNSFILVHQYNGISIFGGTPLKLENQYCFHEEGYQIGDACYEPLNEVLALSFVRPDHEKIILFDLKSGSQRVILPATYKGESFSNMCFSNSGKHFLITSQYRCIEHDIVKGINSIVSNSGENERFVSGLYVDEQIEIAVVEHSSVAAPKVEPYCIYYNKQEDGSKTTFVRSWYYLMPKLDKALFSKFIFQNNDLGALGSFGEDGFQQYWATRGFFLEDLPEINKLLHPKSYSWRGNHIVSVEKTFHKYDMLYVYHTSELTNQYGCGQSGYNYVFLSDDMSEAILIKDKQKLLHCKDIKRLNYKEIATEMENYSSKANQNAFWDFVVPKNDGNLLGCYEFYNLIEVRADNNALLNMISYYPGISIMGCKFNKTISDEYVSDIISANNRRFTKSK